MICVIFMICILLLSVTFVMYFNGRNKDIYLFIIFNNEWMNVKNAVYFHREISLNSLWLLELALCSASFIVSLFLQ